MGPRGCVTTVRDGAVPGRELLFVVAHMTTLATAVALEGISSGSCDRETSASPCAGGLLRGDPRGCRFFWTSGAGTWNGHDRDLIRPISHFRLEADVAFFLLGPTPPY